MRAMRKMWIGPMLVLAMLAGACGDTEDATEGQPPSSTGVQTDSAQSDNTSANGAHTGG
jgi:hypothetical protein